MKPQIHFVARAIAVFAVCTYSAPAWCADSTTPVRAALGKLETWLGKGANREAWNKHLNLSGLQSELDKGDKADRAVVGTVLKSLEGSAPGLELPDFVALRSAVSHWSDDLAIAQAPSLSDAALGAEGSFTPPTDAELAAAKAKLQAAANKLGRYLSGANGAAWKEYLKWNDLTAQLQAATPDVDALKGVQNRFVSDKVGLELPIFSHVTDALVQYIDVAAARREDRKAQYAEQLKALAADLTQYAQQATGELALSLGNRLGWLQSAGQAPALVRAVRERYSQPNLHVRASERLMGAGIAQLLDEDTPVRDFILGTDIRGKGRTVGKIKADLVPSEDKLLFDTMLEGTVQTRNVGYNGPATIHTNGTTLIAGRKRIFFDEHGFSSYPATAAARTNTQVTGIGGSGIVQRVASRRVGEQKSTAERIGSDHASDRVRERMDQQVAQQLGEAQGNYLRKFRDPLLRRRELPQMWFRTTEDSVFVKALGANRNQIGATGQAPEIKVDNDLAVQIHESMINNAANALLAGETIREEDMQKQIVEMRGSLPDNLKTEEDRDPWTITFAKSRPVSVKFYEDGLQITVRAEKFISGDGKPWGAMNITADYKFQIHGPGVKLVRQGDLVIVPPNFVPGKGSLSVRQIALREKLEKRFGKLFEPEVVYEGLILPGKWREAGRLDLKQMQGGNGWLALAWIESGVPAPPQDKPDRQTEKKADRMAGPAR